MFLLSTDIHVHVHVLYLLKSAELELTINIQYASKKTSRFRSVFFPFTSVLTVYHGQTVLALGVNLSAKFTACVGEAQRYYFQRLHQETGFFPP